MPSDAVIDNDNLAKVVDDAEIKRAAGASPVFLLDPGGNAFHVSSPDVSCSLSFTGKGSQASDSLLLEDLPRAELAKLDGPATLDGDSLQVSVHNATAWELREVVIGLTIVQRSEPAEASAGYGQPRMIPAVADLFAQPEAHPKQPDMTILLKVKGSATPSATALFRTALNFALFPDQDWHWAIVKAKGIPPQTSPVEAANAQTAIGGQPSQGVRQIGVQNPSPLPAASNTAATQQLAPPH